MPVSRSYGVKKVNENIMHEGRALILTNLSDADFSTLPAGTIYVDPKTGAAKIKLQGATDWKVFQGFGSNPAASVATIEDLKKKISILQTQLDSYAPRVNQNSDTVSQTISTVNDLVKKTSDYSSVTERQDQQILEFGRRLNDVNKYKEDLAKEKQERVDADNLNAKTIEQVSHKYDDEHTDLVYMIDTERSERKAADTAETNARAAADKAETSARIAADTNEASIRKSTDDQERKERLANYTELTNKLTQETSERQSHDTSLQNQINQQTQSINQEAQTRKATDDKIRADLTNAIGENVKKIQTISDHVDAVSYNLTNEWQATKDEVSKTTKAEEQNRQQADEEIRTDYTAKFNKAKLNIADAEQKITDHDIRLTNAENDADDLKQALATEKNERLAKNTAHEKSISDLSDKISTNLDSINSEQQTRADADTKLNDLILSKASDQTDALSKEAETRKAADDKLTEDQQTTKNYVDTLVAQGGAKCITVDKTIAPGNGISVVFPVSGLTPYERSVKVLVLDNEAGSRTNGMYINAEAICTTAYTDTEYRLYNDSEETHDFRLVFS